MTVKLHLSRRRCNAVRMPAACDADWTTLHRLVGHASGEAPSHVDNENISTMIDSFICGASGTDGVHPRKHNSPIEPFAAKPQMTVRFQLRVDKTPVREIVTIASSSPFRGGEAPDLGMTPVSGNPLLLLGTRSRLIPIPKERGQVHCKSHIGIIYIL